MRLTAIVPSSGGWQNSDAVVRALLDASEHCDLDVLVVSAQTDDPPPPDLPNLRYVSIPQHDIFAAHAAGVMLATGDIVALLEDHALPDPNWATELLATWNNHPEADAVVHTARTSPKAKAWELALFVLTFGPFLGVSEAPRDRIPIPGMVSFRRSLLPSSNPPLGWLEYDFLAKLASELRMVMAPTMSLLHLQPVGWKAPVLSFASGRMYAGSASANSSLGRRRQLRRVRGDACVILQQTFAARKRINNGEIGICFGACALAVIAANLFGQLVAIATRSVGNSAAKLQ